MLDIWETSEGQGRTIQMISQVILVKKSRSGRTSYLLLTGPLKESKEEKVSEMSRLIKIEIVPLMA